MFLRISILGGDNRQFYLLLHLLKQLTINHIPFSIKCFAIPVEHCPYKVTVCEDVPSLLDDCDILICPVPFSDELVNLPLPKIVIGGNIGQDILHNPLYNQTTFYDYMKDSHFLRTNSDLTAEGLLKYIIENTDSSISDSKILITGLGQCGNAIAKKLSLLGGTISFYDKDTKKISDGILSGFKFFDISAPDNYPDFHIVVNTIPSPIFKAPFLRRFRNNTVFFDIASAPGGFDDTVIMGLNINLIKCPKIPGKTAPQSAGTAISEYIFENIILSII